MIISARAVNPRSLVTALGLIGTSLAVASILTMGAHSVLLLIGGQIGQESLTIATGQWALAAAAILTSLAFLVLIPVRINRDWRTHGVFAAFIVSLFAEMYGFPLTAYFLSSILGLTFFEKEFMLYMYAIGMPLGALISTLGILLVIIGWREVYRAKGGLATTGVYAYLRHPQYLGILLVTTGWVTHWPTVPGILLWPILVVLYYRLARREDAYLVERFGNEYTIYAARTPMFLPHWRKGQLAITR